MLDQSTALIRQQLVGRIRLGTTFTDDFRKNVNDAFDVLDRLETQRDRVNKDTNLSDPGKLAAVASMVKETLAPALAAGPGRRARHSAQRNTSHRAAIGKPKFDPSDLVAAHDRAEVRTYLRSLPQSERMQEAFELVKDRTMAEAILSGNGRALTGLSADVFEKLDRIYLETFHAEDLGEVETLQGDIEALTAAVQLVFTKLYGASGMSETAFREFWYTLELAADRS